MPAREGRTKIPELITIIRRQRIALGGTFRKQDLCLDPDNPQWVLWTAAGEMRAYNSQESGFLFLLRLVHGVLYRLPYIHIYIYL